MFNMAHMGLRLAQRANGVSKLHGVVSREMFGGLWPGFDIDRGADQLGHQRRARADLGRPRDAGAGRARGRPRARRRRRTAGRASTKVADEAIWATRARCARGWSTRSAGGCASPGCSAASSEAELGWIDTRLRPGRADHRLRPPGAVVQAADADAARPRAADARCCSTRSGRCRSSSPARRTRPTTAARRSIQQMVQFSRRPGRAAPDRVPARLRHRHGAVPLPRAATSG